MTLSVRNCLFTVDEQQLTANFELAPGETKGIYGPSGSGKSTLFRLLSGLTEHGFETGDYTIDHHPFHLFTPSQRIKAVSLMFQNPDTQFCMRTPKEELLFCLENQAIPIQEMAQRVDDALAFCEIQALKDQPITNLSGGEKQLVALACCVILESRYLLLDEPFANLDPTTTQMIIKKLTELQQAKKIGILLIDHQVSSVENWVSEWFLLAENFRAATSTDLINQEEMQRLSLEKPARFSSKGQAVLRFEQFCLPMKNHSLVLDDQTFYQGELIGISGKSGLGKSTFLKALLQQVPYYGTCCIHNRPITSRSRPFEFMSWIMQNPQDQFLAATVAQELTNSQTEVADKLIALRLWEKRDISPFLLSQGQQRRLAVSCLIDREIPILLVDEPTYGQDLQQAWQIMSLLTSKANSGTLVIIISHDLRMLSDFCDRTLDFNQYVKELDDETTKPNYQTTNFIRTGFTRFFSK
jgi:energy-coupling factor transporter ATP-binding protein EcfA2